MTQPSARLVLICGLPTSGKSTLARQLAPKVAAIRLDKWTASPMTRAHFERWATIFQPSDAEEILLFDRPIVEG